MLNSLIFLFHFPWRLPSGEAMNQDLQHFIPASSSPKVADAATRSSTSKLRQSLNASHVQSEREPPAQSRSLKQIKEEKPSKEKGSPSHQNQKSKLQKDKEKTKREANVDQKSAKNVQSFDYEAHLLRPMQNTSILPSKNELMKSQDQQVVLAGLPEEASCQCEIDLSTKSAANALTKSHTSLQQSPVQLGSGTITQDSEAFNYLLRVPPRYGDQAPDEHISIKLPEYCNLPETATRVKTGTNSGPASPIPTKGKEMSKAMLITVELNRSGDMEYQSTGPDGVVRIEQYHKKLPHPSMKLQKMPSPQPYAQAVPRRAKRNQRVVTLSKRDSIDKAGLQTTTSFNQSLVGSHASGYKSIQFQRGANGPKTSLTNDSFIGDFKNGKFVPVLDHKYEGFEHTKPIVMDRSRVAARIVADQIGLSDVKPSLLPAHNSKASSKMRYQNASQDTFQSHSLAQSLTGLGDQQLDITHGSVVVSQDHYVSESQERNPSAKQRVDQRTAQHLQDIFDKLKDSASKAHVANSDKSKISGFLAASNQLTMRKSRKDYKKSTELKDRNKHPSASVEASQADTNLKGKGKKQISRPSSAQTLNESSPQDVGNQADFGHDISRLNFGQIMQAQQHDQSLVLRSSIGQERGSRPASQSSIQQEPRQRDLLSLRLRKEPSYQGQPAGLFKKAAVLHPTLSQTMSPINPNYDSKETIVLEKSLTDLQQQMARTFISSSGQSSADDITRLVAKQAHSPQNRGYAKQLHKTPLRAQPDKEKFNQTQANFSSDKGSELRGWDVPKNININMQSNMGHSSLDQTLYNQSMGAALSTQYGFGNMPDSLTRGAIRIEHSPSLTGFLARTPADVMHVHQRTQRRAIEAKTLTLQTSPLVQVQAHSQTNGFSTKRPRNHPFQASNRINLKKMTSTVALAFQSDPTSPERLLNETVRGLYSSFDDCKPLKTFRDKSNNEWLSPYAFRTSPSPSIDKPLQVAKDRSTKKSPFETLTNDQFRQVKLQQKRSEMQLPCLPHQILTQADPQAETDPDVSSQVTQTLSLHLVENNQSTQRRFRSIDQHEGVARSNRSLHIGAKFAHQQSKTRQDQLLQVARDRSQARIQMHMQRFERLYNKYGGQVSQSQLHKENQTGLDRVMQHVLAKKQSRLRGNIMLHSPPPSTFMQSPSPSIEQQELRMSSIIKDIVESTTQTQMKQLASYLATEIQLEAANKRMQTFQVPRGPRPAY